MSRRPDFERIRRAVAHEEPDRVPLCEASVDYAIQSQLLGREVAAGDLEAQVEFWLKAGYDYLPLVVGMMAPGKVTRDSAISKVIEQEVLEGSAAAEDDAAWNLEYSSFIADRRDFESFPWERAARVDLGDFHAVRAMLPEGMEVIALSGKIFTLAWMMMGFGNFGVSLLTDEGLVAEVIGKIAEIQLGALDEVLEMPHVGAVWAVDDIACGSGTMISPGALRDHIFPWYRELAARCHQAGKLFFLHSDGDLLPVMEELIELGVDALHPIDPTAMDIAQVKQSYGDRLCLIGNVSTELLRSGTPAQVAAAVRELLRSVAPGGGYCLGSGNSIPDWVSVENYRAMLDAAMRHGGYPIACD
jgi:uroporphyrinogen decarboxylase